MAVNGPERAQAIAVFNPTAPAVGFVQPLFAGPPGDNQSYVQILSDLTRIAGFLPVIWPERDCTMLDNQSAAQVGEESLWGFAFPDEAPLVLPWTRFRIMMRERLETKALDQNPLLQFDIVDTLDLADLKRPVFRRAFERYNTIGRQAAENWRDRAILEPALAKVLPVRDDTIGTIFSDSIPSRPMAPYLRARIVGRQVLVALEKLGNGVERLLNEAYQTLSVNHPDLFPSGAEVTVRQRSRSIPFQPYLALLTIVLVGRVREGEVNHNYWARLGVEVVEANSFRPALGPRREAPLTMILGAQSDWRHMVEVGNMMGERRAVLVSLSTSVAPLMSDLEIQNATRHPTISLVAPFVTSRAFKRDPVQPVAALSHILSEEIKEMIEGQRALPDLAQHNLFMREPIGSDHDPIAVTCRLGARALRAGAMLGGKAHLYCLGLMLERDYADWVKALQPLFDFRSPSKRKIFEGRRGTLLLLVERIAHFDTAKFSYQRQEGARRLFEMRGWRIVNDRDVGLTISDDHREFGVAILDSGDKAPQEDENGPTPGFSRASLLVVHTQPKREQLLVGNRGQFFHVAPEDIALMKPGTRWIWPVLRRQLLEANSRPTLAALRLAAVLVVEAIRMGRVQTSFVDVDWHEVEQIMSADDCERFVEFHESGIQRRRAALVTNVGVKRKPQVRERALITLVIEDDGPVTEANVSLEF